MSDAERADQTSAALARPIAESYWVLPGQLLAGEYPGARDPAAAERKLRRLLDAGVTCFIDLTEANEGLRPYWPLAQALARDEPTVEHQRWPIRDLDVPTIAHMAGILSALDQALAAGQVVYLHCWGGIGRTGTVVACSLIERGLAAGAALERLAQLRQGTPDSQRRSPETDAQRAFVLAWQPR